MLCAARQNLEQGKGYRTVRAGPGFTRKFLQALERETIRPRREVPVATIVAAVSIGVMIVVAILLAFFVIPISPEEHAGFDELARVQWVDLPASTRFDYSIGSDWRSIGAMAVDASHGLQPRWDGQTDARYCGGGIVLRNAWEPQQSFAAEISFTLRKPSDDLIVQVFVSDQAQFSSDLAMSPHELVWLIQNGRPRVVLPSRQVAAEGSVIYGGNLSLRILVQRDQAIVECDGRRLWAGAHGLSPGKPRYLGIRFLRRGGDHPNQVVVNGVRLKKPRK